jgi:glycosyltransferase involved in cell wall biosynthesis/uncharacterized protein YjbI with pentapeptide repeats
MEGHRKPADWSLRLIYIFLGFAIALILLQIWSVVETDRLVARAQIAAQQVSDDKVDREKTRQELIGRRVENDSKGAPSIGLATAVSALAATLVAVSGALLTLRGYLDARRKEEQQRTDIQRKDRLDRLGARLNETLTRLVAEEARQRIVGAAGLLPFFNADTADFHLQALTALVAAARIPDETVEVRHAIRLAVEQAVRNVAPSLLRQVSWQRVNLPQVDWSSTDNHTLDLHGLDLRDANLENARLAGSWLDGADLTAAGLQGAMLARARLVDAKLIYADLAGADLTRAVLARASLDGVKVLNADFTETDFRSIGSGWRGVPWDAARNWRKALFEVEVRRSLEATYGRDVPPVHVVMLMWEVPPLIAGGTWTACYHLVRNLRRRGADVTVVVPWRREAILPAPFGVEVPIVALGIELPAAAPGDAGFAASPYRGSYFGSSYYGWSPYGGGVPLWSTYTRQDSGGAARVYGAYPSPYGTGRYAPEAAAQGAAERALSGSILYRLIGEFRRRLVVWFKDNPADLIHAHDWVTFDAARDAAIATPTPTPWVAHFHSTEIDRNPDAPDPLTERIERSAIDSATRVVAPSRFTRDRLVSRYGAKPERIDVVANTLSEGAAPTSEMGRFETKQVLFVGRLSRQKGVDRYCALADKLREASDAYQFKAVGDGEEAPLLQRHGIESKALGWDERGQAYRGASVLVVPSRSEPFGMVILEGMQHRVPVIYPKQAGAAEVLESGIKVEANDVEAMSTAVGHLLQSLDAWEAAVRGQAREIEAYPRRDDPDRLMAVWARAVQPAEPVRT